jgi:hypothetical protein
VAGYSVVRVPTHTSESTRISPPLAITPVLSATDVAGHGASSDIARRYDAGPHVEATSQPLLLAQRQTIHHNHSPPPLTRARVQISSTRSCESLVPSTAPRRTHGVAPRSPRCSGGRAGPRPSRANWPPRRCGGGLTASRSYCNSPSPGKRAVGSCSAPLRSSQRRQLRASSVLGRAIPSSIRRKRSLIHRRHSWCRI